MSRCPSCNRPIVNATSGRTGRALVVDLNPPTLLPATIALREAGGMIVADVLSVEETARMAVQGVRVGVMHAELCGQGALFTGATPGTT